MATQVLTNRALRKLDSQIMTSIIVTSVILFMTIVLVIMALLIALHGSMSLRLLSLNVTSLIVLVPALIMNITTLISRVVKHALLEYDLNKA